jgi:hypothetical protein
VPQYDSWEQIAGYFDGDGTISFSDTTNQPYKLSLSLIFVDQSIDQISNVKEFLNDHNVSTGNVLKMSMGNAYMIAVSQFAAVREGLQQLLPHLCKKSNEVRAALDYYEGRTTGNELMAVFQSEVEAGRRERRPRKVPINVPYTYFDGDRIMKLRRNVKLRDAFGRYRAKVTPEDFETIRRKHFEEGRLLPELAKAYPQYSRTTIRRIVGRDKQRSHVLVKGVGSVTTTDGR